MKISDLKDIQAVFNTFHDGIINSHKSIGADLALEIQIAYLAERINSDYTMFAVTLSQLHAIEFEPWYDDTNRKENPILSIENIFHPKLEILSAELEESVIRVSCSQAQPGFGYYGGFVKFEAMAATVQDQSGLFYSLAQLEELSSGYWKEWSEKNA